MLSNLASFLSQPMLMEQAFCERLWRMASEGTTADVKGLFFDAPNPRQMAEEQCAAVSSSGSSMKKAVAVLPVHGVIEQHGSWFSEMMGGTSTDSLSAAIDLCMNEPRIGSVLLDFHTPGGTPFGVKELADKIYAARDEKLVVGISNSMMCSAGAWLGASVDRSFASPMSMNGSVGVYSTFIDESEALGKAGVKATICRIPEGKAAGHPYEPLKQESVEAEMASIGKIYDEFVGSLAKYRGTTALHVKEKYGCGRTLDAKSAVEAGLADGVMSKEQLLDRMTTNRIRRSSSGAAAVVDVEPPKMDARDPKTLRRMVELMSIRQ